jgi:hypothetical protein
VIEYGFYWRDYMTRTEFVAQFSITESGLQRLVDNLLLMPDSKNNRKI